MKTEPKIVTVLGFNSVGKERLFFPGFDNRGLDYLSEEEVAKNKKAADKLTFPCEMEKTGRLDLNYKRILRDPDGIEWTERYFILGGTKND